MSVASEPAIRFQGVQFARRRSVDEGFQLEIDHFALGASERAACIGPSGSGKTTFLHLCCGILQPSKGCVELAGTALSVLPESGRRDRRLREIGLVSQELELLPYLSALDNILLPFRLGAPRPSNAIAKAEQLADATDLSPALLRRRPSQLSQGERQRVAICRALVTDPAVVLCDEPTGNLDPATAHQILDLLFELSADERRPLIMVTHDHSLLDRFDRTFDIREL